MEKYYIISTKNADEFTLGVKEDRDEAIKEARDIYARWCEADRKANKLEIRVYVEDIEQEDCDCFDYNTVSW